MNGFMYIVIFIAVSLVSIIIYEAYVSYTQKVRVYTLADSLVNLYCGILERSGDLFYAVIFLMASQYIYDNIAPFHIPVNLFTWIIGLLIFDLIAYWFHRLSHEINIFWAAHIVHHQSEELNFTTVFRVSVFALLFRSLFFIWMPFMGFDPWSIFTFSIFLGGYQFLTHSRVVGRLGILEKFMTTPSHHRVHHARNEKYMDHNYGHIFIIWDKMFGTFVPEEEEPEYGITSGFESNNAYNAQFAYWKDLFTRAKKTRKLKDKIAVFFKGPSWTPDDVGFLPSVYKTDQHGQRIKRDVRVSKELGANLLISTAVTLSFFVALIAIGKQLEEPSLRSLIANSQIVAFTLFILLSVLAHGQMLENPKTAFVLELTRITALLFVGFNFLGGVEYASWIQPAIVVYSLVAIFWAIKLAFFSRNLIYSAA
jgi:alkylglycerol monooxygenase